MAHITDAVSDVAKNNVAKPHFPLPTSRFPIPNDSASPMRYTWM